MIGESQGRNGIDNRPPRFKSATIETLVPYRRDNLMKYHLTALLSALALTLIVNVPVVYAADQPELTK